MRKPGWTIKALAAILTLTPLSCVQKYNVNIDQRTSESKPAVIAKKEPRTITIETIPVTRETKNSNLLDFNSTKNPRPRYSNNLHSMSEASFESSDFSSEIPMTNFGGSGMRVVGLLPQEAHITDLEGNLIGEDMLPFYTLKEGEYAYYINPKKEEISIKAPELVTEGIANALDRKGLDIGSFIRIYTLVENARGIRTNKGYIEESIPPEAEVYYKAHPRFSIPARDIVAHGDHIRLFYVNTPVMGDPHYLSFVPDCEEFKLFDNNITLLGDVYAERLAILKKPQRPSFIQGELILVDPESNEVTCPPQPPNPN